MKNSLKVRLAALVFVMTVGVAFLAGVVSYARAFKEANKLQDEVLRQIAALIASRDQAVEEARILKELPAIDRELRVVIRILKTPQAASAQSGKDASDFPEDLPEGMHYVDWEGKTWRLLVKTLDSGARIAIGQKTTERDEIARGSALRTLVPLAVLIPILLLVVGRLIRRMFQPVTLLAAKLEERKVSELQEVSPAGLPTEILPFVAAINHLLSRVALSVAQQRRFVADAAHELRSPLTALSLQAERLAGAEMSPAARERLAALQGAIQRTRALLDQLLTLARAQEPASGKAAPVPVQRVFRRVVEDLLPQAEVRQIDIGVTTSDEVEVLAPEFDLQTLVKNLVDNAIRYTPPGGRVDLAARKQGTAVILSVADTGPGIPEAEWQLVFDPFYRVLGSEGMGSGLGLAIVKAIADRLGATVELKTANPAQARGLMVSVGFPAPVQAAPSQPERQFALG